MPRLGRIEISAINVQKRELRGQDDSKVLKREDRLPLIYAGCQHRAGITGLRPRS